MKTEAQRRSRMDRGMKRAIRFFCSAALVACLSMTFACGGGHSHDHGDGSQTEEAAQGKEYTSKYVCPMHCEGSGSDEAGKCPACGMDYVLNEDYKE